MNVCFISFFWKVNPSVALIIARDIACGLEFLHEAVSNSQTGLRVPVAHRDIKSSNILLRSKDHAVISDFGLAITLNNVPDGTATDGNGFGSAGSAGLDMDVHRLKRCGTPRYLSPELLEGPMDVHNFADAFRQGKISAKCCLGQGSKASAGIL